MSNSKNVTAWRRRAKLKLLQRHGNRCVDCGNTFPPVAMTFDHRDPTLKVFSLSGKTLSMERLIEESDKCDLVCANCHNVRTHAQRLRGALAGRRDRGHNDADEVGLMATRKITNADRSRVLINELQGERLRISAGQRAAINATWAEWMADQRHRHLRRSV